MTSTLLYGGNPLLVRCPFNRYISRRRLQGVAVVGTPGRGAEALDNMGDKIFSHPFVTSAEEVLKEYETVEERTPDRFSQGDGAVGPLDESAYASIGPRAQSIKRSLDLLLVIIAAPVWIPLCTLLALLIWLEDRENPFFLQTRVGQGDQLFSIYKFRTMVPRAEEVLLQKMAEDEELRREWEQSYKLENDPRITRVGKFLRRSSLDELPQLINVLRGDMSLVGPRPLPRYHHDELSSRVRMLRQRARPGITGLWQVTGRSNAGTDGMERWDPYYVQNWSLRLDLVVLIRTIPVVVRGSGAY